MCLQAPGTRSRGSTPVAGATVPVAARPKDAAFKEFLRLQSGFEWNGWSSLFVCLEWEKGANGSSHYTADFVFGEVIGEDE